MKNKQKTESNVKVVTNGELIEINNILIESLIDLLIAKDVITLAENQMSVKQTIANRKRK